MVIILLVYQLDLNTNKLALIAYWLDYGIECLTDGISISFVCIDYDYTQFLNKDYSVRSLNWLKAGSTLCLGDIGQSGSTIMCVDGEICKLAAIRDEN